MSSHAAGEPVAPDRAARTDRAAGADRSDRSDRSDRADDGRRRRWAEHRLRRRAAFVAAGARAIDAHGPDASAEQIAGAAGVSRTVLYRYFRDREELRQAIADAVVATVVAGVRPHLRLTAESTPRRVVTSTVGEIVGWLDEHPNLYYFLRDRRNGSALETVENSLADQVAAVLKVLLMHVGIDAAKAEPGAYGMVGFVESSGSWWLGHRTMSREKFAEFVCDGVWYLLEGTARTNNLTLGYDDPLPMSLVDAAACGSG
jgi:AcrR family transcriptional regulator